MISGDCNNKFFLTKLLLKQQNWERFHITCIQIRHQVRYACKVIGERLQDIKKKNRKRWVIILQEKYF